MVRGANGTALRTSSRTMPQVRVRVRVRIRVRGLLGKGMLCSRFIKLRPTQVRVRVKVRVKVRIRVRVRVRSLLGENVL